MNIPLPCELSHQDKRLLNILEIKIYDLTQNVEILTRQLTNNQIKDVVAQIYNIFCQLRQIFDRMGVKFLYEIVRKMQFNSVLICSILTDNLDKQTDSLNISKKENQPQKSKLILPIESNVEGETDSIATLSVKIPRLGGINLYNQTYKRGLQYYQVTDITNLQQLAGKCRVKQSKKFKQNLLDSVMNQIDNKTDVELQNVNDQINSYIRNYKQNDKIGSCISYEKELSEIIDFFKSSQMEAMTFLNKSPNKNNQYTEDYMNRLSDLQRDIKLKENKQKHTLVYKMKEFIQKFKEKIADIEKAYQQKNIKLQEFQKSLKKELTSNSTQTNDNYQRKMKQMENLVRETEQKYIILNSLRKNQFNYQDKIYDLNNQIQGKSNQNKKLRIVVTEQEEELQFLKRIIRDNKEKINVPTQMERKKPKKKTKYVEMMSKKIIEENKESTTTKLLEKYEQQSPVKKNQVDQRELRQERKTKKHQKFGTLSSTNGYRPSIETEVISDFLNQYDQTVQSPLARLRADDSKKGTIISSSSKNRQSLQQYQAKEKKQTQFKNQGKKNQKKMSEQEKQVSFNVNDCQEAESSIPNSASSKSPRGYGNIPLIRQRSNQNSRSMINIEDQINEVNDHVDTINAPIVAGQNSITFNKANASIYLNSNSNQSANIESEDIDGQYTRRSNRKNTLKQRIDIVSSSKYIEEPSDSKKSSKNVSKKCIILKQNKQKNIITTSFKMSKFAINQQFTLLVQSVSNQNDQPSKAQRYSNPLDNHSSELQHNSVNGLSGSKGKHVFKEIKNKIRSNFQSTYNVQGKVKGGASQDEQFISNKSIKKDGNPILIEKKKSKKQFNNKNSKRQFNQFTATLMKKSKKEISKNQFKMDNQPTVKNNFRKIAAYLEKVKELSLGKRLQSEQWLGQNETIEDSDATIVNYIFDALDKDQYRIDQFKEVIKIVDEDYFCLQTDEHKKYSGKQYSKKKTQEQEQSFQNLNSKNIKNKQLFKQFQVVQKSKSKSKCKGKQQTDGRLKNEEVKYEQKTYPLSIISLQRIRQLHSKNSKCHNNQNKMCEHLQKYLSILKRISELGTKSKLALKLPIQKIGESDHQNNLSQEMINKLSMNRTKIKRQINDSQTSDRLQPNSKWDKTNQSVAQNYLRNCSNTDQYLSQKQRILPIISSTTSNYYKGKNKITK